MVLGRGEFVLRLAVSPMVRERFDADEILRPVLDAWPVGLLRPKIEHIDWETLKTSSSPIDGVLVVLMCTNERESTHRMLEGFVEESMSAALVLCEPSERPTAVLGAPTLSWETDPGIIATATSTLAARQEVIDRIAGEFRLSQMMLDGVQRQLIEWNREMRQASGVQREFLPNAQLSLDGLDIGVVYRPAGDVSGDVYDLRQLDDHTVAFFIADAVGHGVPAAMMTQIIARSLRMTEGTGEDLRILSPGEALGRLNHELVHYGGSSSRFATAVYGLIDTSTGEIRMAGAGHPPPIICSPGGSRRVPTDGPLLGVFDEAEFTECVFTLNAGEVLVLFSDGFEMAFPDSGASGDALRRPTQTHLDRLAQVSSKSGLRHAAVELNAELDKQAGSLHQPDDVTALLIAPASRDARIAA
ncbi:MAG: serine phosphatase RsbU (regulator of sigma subunit) [Phycisphaerales bacterium]|jgi:serine phosphatase RsbU (regulator of sigma subunit)